MPARTYPCLAAMALLLLCFTCRDGVADPRQELLRVIGHPGPAPVMDAQRVEHGTSDRIRRSPHAMIHLAPDALPEIDEIAREDIVLVSQAGDIVGVTIARPLGLQGPRPVAIIQLGAIEEPVSLATAQTGDMAHLTVARELAEQGYITAFWQEQEVEKDLPTALALLPEGTPMLGRKLRAAGMVLEHVLALGDVDPERVVVVAHGQRAWPALLLAVLDQRVTALCVAGVAGTSAWYAQLNSPPPPFLWLPGLFEHYDTWNYLALVAPRPILFLGGSRDTRVSGAAVGFAADMVLAAYHAKGVGDRIHAEVTDDNHEFSREQRALAYRWLASMQPVSATQPMTLWDNAPEPDTPDTLTPDTLESLLGARQSSPLLGRVATGTNTIEMRRELLLVGSSSLGMSMQGWLLRPLDARERLPVVISLHRWVAPYTMGRNEPAGIDGDPDHAFGPALVKRGLAVLCPDLVGHGSYVTPEVGRNHLQYPENRVEWPAVHSLWYGRTQLQFIADDIRQWIAFLEQHPGIDASQLTLLGDDASGLAAIVAAVGDPRITKVITANGPSTHAAMALHDLVGPPVCHVPNLGRHGGWEAVAALLPPGMLSIITTPDNPLWPLSGARALAQAAKGELIVRESKAQVLTAVVDEAVRHYAGQ